MIAAVWWNLDSTAVWPYSVMSPENFSLLPIPESSKSDDNWELKQNEADHEMKKARRLAGLDQGFPALISAG